MVAGCCYFRQIARAEAEQIVAADPLVQNHCVSYLLHEWRIILGEPSAESSIDSIAHTRLTDRGDTIDLEQRILC